MQRNPQDRETLITKLVDEYGQKKRHGDLITLQAHTKDYPDLFKDIKETLVARVVDEYTQRKLQGDAPGMQAYLDTYPELAEQIREDIESWEWLTQVSETRDFPDSVHPTEDRWATLKPKLEQVWHQQFSKDSPSSSEEAQIIVLPQTGVEQKFQRRNWQELDKVTEFSALIAVVASETSGEDQKVRKAAESGIGNLFEDIETQLISGNKGVIYTDPSSGHLYVQLNGSTEEICGVGIALCDERELDGSWIPRLEAQTDESGIADFGKIDELPKPKPESSVYAICLESEEGSDSES